MDDAFETTPQIQELDAGSDAGESVPAVDEFDYELMAQSVYDAFEGELIEVKTQIATDTAFCACGFGILAGLVLALLLHRVLNYG